VYGRRLPAWSGRRPADRRSTTSSARCSRRRTAQYAVRPAASFISGDVRARVLHLHRQRQQRSKIQERSRLFSGRSGPAANCRRRSSRTSAAPRGHQRRLARGGGASVLRAGRASASTWASSGARR
jgi:hypothetical protein